MSVGQWGQWILLVGFTLLFMWLVLLGYLRSRLRPVCFLLGTIAITHVAYYTLFLVYPHILDATETMLFSIAIRLHVLFALWVGSLLLFMRGRWR